MKKFNLFSLLLIFISLSVQAQQITDFQSLNEYKQFKQQIDAEANQDLGLSGFSHPSSNYAKSTIDEYGNPADWTRAEQFGGSGADAGRDVTFDAEGNVYVAGTFSGDINIGSSSFSSNGHHDGYIAKFDDNGSFLWLSLLPAAADKKVDIKGICLDDEGNVYITGYYTGSVNFNGIVLDDDNPQNLFFAKLNNSGEVLLAKSYDVSYSGGEGGKIELDLYGNIYVLGIYLDAYHYSSVVLKYDSSGILIWDEHFSSIEFNDLSISGQNIYYAGTVHEPGGYLGQIELNPKGYHEAFTAKGNLAGEFDWAVMGDHSGNDFAHSKGLSFALDENENVYLGGEFYNYVIFGDDTITNPGSGYPGFLIKFNSSGNPLWNQIIDERVNNVALDQEESPHVQFKDFFEKYNPEGIQQWKTQLDKLPSCICFNSGNKLLSCGEEDELAFVNQMNENTDEDWTVEVEGNSGHAYVIGMATDKFGGVYTYAYASAEMDYFGQTIFKGTFLSRQKGDGELDWLHQFEDFYHEHADIGAEIVIDPSHQYVYVTGELQEPLKIPGEQTLTPGEDGGFYIIKYNTSGVFQLAIQEEIKARDMCLAADYTGSIIVSGVFNDTVSIGGTTLASAGSGDVFIIKYNSLGEMYWAKRAGGEEMEYIGIISVDGNDNVYLSGEFTSENVTVDNTPIHLGEGDGNVLFAKLNAAGQTQWVKSFSGSPVAWADYYGWPTGIKTDSLGNTYLKGWHSDSCYFDNIMLRSTYSRYSFFITKIDPDGNVYWANTINRRQARGFDYNDMDIDNLGNVYFGAQVWDTLNFGNDYMYINSGPYDLFVTKYTTDGELDWVKIIDNEKGYTWLGNVTIYDTESLFVGGHFDEDISFDGMVKKSTNRHGFVAMLGESPLGVNEGYKREDLSVTVYPNPSKGIFSISFTEPANELISVRVSNSRGQIIFEDELDSGNQNTIDLSHNAKGIYFIYPSGNYSFKAKKLVVE